MRTTFWLSKSPVPWDCNGAEYEDNDRSGHRPGSWLLNSTDRWRRVLVLRYMAASGTAGPKEYEDYRNGEKFDREPFLVRGSDVSDKVFDRALSNSRLKRSRL